VARLSHLPQLTASALVSLAIRSGDEEALLGLAAGGFRDVTRIAASDPDLWVGILRSNRSSILRALTEMGQLFKDLEVRLQGEDWPGLRSFLAEAQQARISLFQKPSHGGAPTTLTMLIPDRPGVLAEVTTAAGELGANIEDLALFHSPEGGQGRLELVISGGSGAAALEARLTGLGYEVEEGLPT
jgi:prephenate dehydrogenase